MCVVRVRVRVRVSVCVVRVRVGVGVSVCVSRAARRLAQRVQLLAPPLVRGAELLEALGQPLDLRGELLRLVLRAVGLRVRALLGVPDPGGAG